MIDENVVSTHSRPKAAVPMATAPIPDVFSFNTQPPEGGCKAGERGDSGSFSFNTQPPEGGCEFGKVFIITDKVSTHSRPKAAGPSATWRTSFTWFQHTAARRRLDCSRRRPAVRNVSTHSRPKAAETGIARFSFTLLFQHTAARRRLINSCIQSIKDGLFQHTAARRRLPGKGLIMATQSVSTHSRPKAAAHLRQILFF